MDWSGLPDHLLDLIAQRLSFPDLFCFGCVCKSWQSVCGPMQFRNHLPWLLVPHQDYTTSKPGTMAFDNPDVGFYSLCDGSIYKADIPEISNTRVCGSFPGGWLMTVHDNSQVQLFNPFSRDLVHLPPLTTFPRVLRKTEIQEGESFNLYYEGTRFDSPQNYCFKSKYMRDIYISKVVMSSSSITTGTLIMAIQGLESSLAFYRIGGNPQVWTSPTQDLGEPYPGELWFLHDLAYYNGKFYAVQGNGHVIVIQGVEDTSGTTTPYLELVISQPSEKLPDEFYIVESSGDLLVVLRYHRNPGDPENDIYKNEYKIPPHKTLGFKVLKLEFGSTNEWVEVESLGDRALFVGYNSSFSLSSSQSSGCKPNCIYFTDDFWGYFHEQGFGGQDLGIFNLEDGSIEKFLYPKDTLFVMPPPVWIAPPSLSC